MAADGGTTGSFSKADRRDQGRDPGSRAQARPAEELLVRHLEMQSKRAMRNKQRGSDIKYIKRKISDNKERTRKRKGTEERKGKINPTAVAPQGDEVDRNGPALI
ncbi:hypothetical protein ASPWEDRAFT_27442 [Aspergillus wentii DTO 134E9]|uniref:Uncharacterized protein n=1 Tax=Aspergillus wentii DTO 134E9 TaxID=1073089 RepID=A0A1L9RII7_ASPWE|nr:uncharacterized protein ASPWEDRAFT_27442 [Aspergillus wentii DTO 134E9]OJJ34750.1 hypothetical protein ASPWEDRAFT_27442 [Aspergillus wentii DTO 134E9]